MMQNPNQLAQQAQQAALQNSFCAGSAKSGPDQLQDSLQKLGNLHVRLTDLRERVGQKLEPLMMPNNVMQNTGANGLPKTPKPPFFSEMHGLIEDINNICSDINEQLDRVPF